MAARFAKKEARRQRAKDSMAGSVSSEESRPKDWGGFFGACKTPGARL